MIYIAVFSGLRISELIGLKWNDAHYNSLTVDEQKRYCRGDWIKPRHRRVLRRWESRIPLSHAFNGSKRLRSKSTGAESAKKRIKLVRSDGPTDLVFQSMRAGAPMRDENILRRHLRPAVLRVG